MNRKGASLVEITVALGVMAILALAISTMIANQRKESRSVSESLAKLDLERLLIATLASGEICTFELTQPTPKTFDSTAIAGASPPTISLTSLHASANASAPLLVQTGAQASAVSSSLVVNSIVFGNIVGAGSPDNFLADLKIDFDPTKMVRALKPITLKMSLTTDPTSPANAKIITGCLRAPGSGNLWTLTPDNSGNIYYNSGNVAVGSINPQAKLDVNGGIKLGDDSGPCDLLREGTIRYNFTSKALEVCNGTTWLIPSSCTSGPPEVYTASPSYSDGCGTVYTLVPGCYTASGNPVNASCLVGSGLQFRRAQSGSGCGGGYGCNAVTGAREWSGSNLPCSTCYKKFTKP